MRVEKTMIILPKFNEEELPEIVDFLKDRYMDSRENILIQHSIVEFTSNKVYKKHYS